MKYTDEQIMQLAKEGRVLKLVELRNGLRHSNDLERKAFIEKQIDIAEEVAINLNKIYDENEEKFEPTRIQIIKRLTEYVEALQADFPNVDIKLKNLRGDTNAEISVNWKNIIYKVD